MSEELNIAAPAGCRACEGTVRNSAGLGFAVDGKSDHFRIFLENNM
jgi:hypothetical protein